MTHIEKLRELAAQATPGKWSADRHGLGVFQKNGPIVAELMNKSGAFTNHEADAAYIASLSPDVVVRLLDVVQAAKSLLPVLDQHLFEEGPEEVALRAALDALEKMDGQHQQEKTG